MTNIRKILFRGSPVVENINEYVGQFGDYILDPSTGQILFHDGATVGGITIGSSGTTFTGMTLSLVTTPPNDGINAGLILASGGTADQDLVISPIGAGAFVMRLADGTSNGGNKRGAYAADLQVFPDGKNSPTQVASGQSSFACNGANTASGYASFASGLNTVASNFCSYSQGFGTTALGQYSHAEGYSTTATGPCAHAEGQGTQSTGDASHSEGLVSIASGDYSHAEGYSTTASNTACHAEGESSSATGGSAHAEGQSTQATGDYSHAEGCYTFADAQGSQATGQNSWCRGINYYQAYSSGNFANLGDQQAGRLLLKGQTADNTPHTLTSDGQAASTVNQFILPTNSVIGVTGSVVVASTTGVTAMFSFVALLKNLAGTVTVVGSPSITKLFSDAGTSSWTIVISADNTNKAVAVVVTGAIGTSIFWTAEVHSQELVTI